MPDAPWYKDAVIYELHVRSFVDSNGDGMGDFRGLTGRLDYLRDLGVTAIWLLPFYPSPWRDDGYDIADYNGVHPAYGTLGDFKRFLKEAHARDLRVITELVINHTSNQHAWFERARRAKPGSAHRDFYVWSDDPARFSEARIIFQDFETSNWTWDPVAQSYYWHRFFSHQPDLNFDNPEVRKAVFKVLDDWFELGVDGMRLDAVPYLFERDGTNCENLPETHAFLKSLRAHMDAKYPGRMLLAEANQWPEDTVPYFGDGDECHMAFHFPLMPRLFMGVRMEDSFPLVDILEQTPPIPENAQWGIFLRNHDELTLEMVTDEERDYMYRVYARDPHHRVNLGIRRRLAPLLDNDRRKLELLNALLFSLPGTPVIYYGDEIGMGDNVYLGDRNGVRTPMQWSPDRNAGFSAANPQSLYLPLIIDPEYHYEQVNVEKQSANESSLLVWMKRLIAARKRHPAFGRGSIRFVRSNNAHLLVFVREYRDEKLLVIANFSRYSQPAELSLEEYVDHVPEDVFSQAHFPAIADRPYPIMVGSSDFYWFVLLPVAEPAIGAGVDADAAPIAFSDRDWRTLSSELRATLERSTLPRYIAGSRWYREKASSMRGVGIVDHAPLGEAASRSWLLIVRVELGQDRSARYLVVLSRAGGAEARRIASESPASAIAWTESGDLVYDGFSGADVRRAMFDLVTGKTKLRSAMAVFEAQRGRHLPELLKAVGDDPTSRVLSVEQSNTSVVYGDRLFLKIYRKIEEGANPDVELSRYLTETRPFERVPRYAASLGYATAGGSVANARHGAAVALLTTLEANQGDGWSYALGAVDRYFGAVLASSAPRPDPPASIFACTLDDVPSAFGDLAGGLFLEMVHVLGRRTAELHLALAADSDRAEFRPEAFSKLYQRSVYQSLRTQIRRSLETAKRLSPSLNETNRALVARYVDSEDSMLRFISAITSHRIDAQKIRIHGDYHLGQVLFTGRDFTIIDLEGEPARSLSERLLKYSAFRDVAGMVRSFHYAISSRYLSWVGRPEDREILEPWIEPWFGYVAAVFLDSYLAGVASAGFVPADRADVELLVNTFMLEKAIYEVGYEINNRPDWIAIPLRGVTFVLGALERQG